MMDQNANTTFRYSDNDLSEFREIVEKKLSKAKEELGYLQEQILEITENSGDDHGGDWMDDSSTNNDIEFLNNMAIRQRKYIQDLENAVVRIKNKTYGICMISGHLIDKRRLLAVPTATKSVEAKNAEAQKEIQKPGEKKPASELLEKLEKVEVPTPPKIITKVIRKPKNPPVKPVNVDDDDDDLFADLDDKEYGYDSADDEDSTDSDSDVEKGSGSAKNEEYDDDNEYNF